MTTIPDDLPHYTGCDCEWCQRDAALSLYDGIPECRLCQFWRPAAYTRGGSGRQAWVLEHHHRDPLYTSQKYLHFDISGSHGYCVRSNPGNNLPTKHYEWCGEFKLDVNKKKNTDEKRN